MVQIQGMCSMISMPRPFRVYNNMHAWTSTKNGFGQRLKQLILAGCGGLGRTRRDMESITPGRWSWPTAMLMRSWWGRFRRGLRLTIFAGCGIVFALRIWSRSLIKPTSYGAKVWQPRQSGRLTVYKGMSSYKLVPVESAAFALAHVRVRTLLQSVWPVAQHSFAHVDAASLPSRVIPSYTVIIEGEK